MKTIVRILRVSLLCLTALFYNPGAVAMSGNDLLQDCRSQPGWKSGYCLGFIVGHAYGYEAGRAGGALHQYFGRIPEFEEIKDRMGEVRAVERLVAYYCIPSAVSQGQLRDVVIKYLEDNPALRHLDAEAVIGAALKKAFPCR